jgi:hypothetical protein
MEIAAPITNTSAIGYMKAPPVWKKRNIESNMSMINLALLFFA